MFADSERGRTHACHSPLEAWSRWELNGSRLPGPDSCPSLQHCEFRMRGHYHCLRTGCYFVTNITTKLPWHIKKHEKAERRAANGFKYFTKREECGRLGTEGQGWGQGTTAGGRAAALAPEALGPTSCPRTSGSMFFFLKMSRYHRPGIVKPGEQSKP